MGDEVEPWALVCTFMQKHCAVVLTEEQRYLLGSRLSPVARGNNFPSVAEFVVAACSQGKTSKLGKELIDAMTTHESYFFRDTTFWHYLEKIVLADLAARKCVGLRIWSAACSHGQEPYSLAMLLDELHPKLAERSQIVATDISEGAILRARDGLYSSLEINRGLHALRLMRYFEKAGGGYRVKASLRQRVRFAAHNLLADEPAMLSCDIVLCRNVLIYFNEADRKTVLTRLDAAARPGGYLGFGTGERCTQPALAPGWHQKKG